jgi:hypothetical protein
VTWPPAQRLWRLLEGSPEKPTYWLTRSFFLRGLGMIYVVAFLIILNQLDALIGSRGLLPVPRFLGFVAERFGDNAVFTVPTIFWMGATDPALHGVAWIGLLVSILVVMGFANGPMMFVLWAIYLSFLSVGQQFWSFGWETYLVEIGFLAIFLCPVIKPWPLPENKPPNPVVIWLIRWVLFRMMLGAGLIKLRGDPCWTELTCLETFYETQPNPNPLAWYWHNAPTWFLTAGVLLNHLVELIGPFLLFGPRRVRHAGGALMIGFQLLLIAGGNLAFLNWLTIVNAIACFDDTLLRHLVPKFIRDSAWQKALEKTPTDYGAKGHLVAIALLAGMVGYLSIDPIKNLASERQVMNTTYDPLRLVNTYGMFGSISETRLEAVIEGTLDDPSDPNAVWHAYVFPCKPGPVDRRPCLITPYHYRLDWQVWFTPLTRSKDPWFVHMLYKLLVADSRILAMLAEDPFQGQRPRAVRVDFYRYEFAAADSTDWWVRERVGAFVSPLTLDNAEWVGRLRQWGFELDP